MPSSSYQRIYDVVNRIPKGRVATYGQVAYLAGIPRHARQVGYALSALQDGQKVPWHRVINAQGACSTGRIALPSDKQQRMLVAEGVEFNERGRCDLQRYLWIPRERRARNKSTLKK